ncbi:MULTISPECIES: glycosyltransferase family 4 protein [Anaerolinea]|uniref:glycosyltransferase family 4 protein n=1 Tax=Anaerolinea TaxID=233189 RepID=UPI002628ED80|nr:glycosyltransferase family 4 protein [Anaerolinea thermophila]
MGAHIGYICEEYPPSLHGGIGTMTRDLAENLVQKGYQVTIVGVHPQDKIPLFTARKEVLKGVDVVRLSSTVPLVGRRVGMLFDRLWLYVWVKKIHLRHPFQIIETPDYQGPLALGAPRLVPLVCRLNGSALHFDLEMGVQRASRLTYFFEKQQLSRAQSIVAVSDYTGRKTIEQFGLKNRSFDVIHNAVDSQFFTPNLQQSISSDGIIFIGSLVWRKGIDEFLNAMILVCQKFSPCKVYIVGKSTPIRIEEFKNRIPEGIRDQFVFTGHVNRNELLTLLRQTFIAVFPSKAEAFPIAPLEAMAVGKAVVLTNRTSGPEVIEDGISGLLCNPYDPLDIAEKVVMLLKNPRWAVDLGINARKRVIERFDKDEWLSRNIAFYQKLW